MRKLTLTLAVVLTCAGVLAACSDDDDTADTADAMTSVCDNQDAVAEDLSSLATLDPADTTSEDLSSMVDDLKSSVDDLQAAKSDLAEQDVDNVQTAFDALVSSLQDLDEVPLSELDAEAITTVGEAITEFQSAYSTAYENSSCGAETTETTEG